MIPNIPGGLSEFLLLYLLFKKTVEVVLKGKLISDISITDDAIATKLIQVVASIESMTFNFIKFLSLKIRGLDHCSLKG